MTAAPRVRPRIPMKFVNCSDCGRVARGTKPVTPTDEPIPPPVGLHVVAWVEAWRPRGHMRPVFNECHEERAGE